jgi:hypothetical protein
MLNKRKEYGEEGDTLLIMLKKREQHDEKGYTLLLC